MAEMQGAAAAARATKQIGHHAQVTLLVFKGGEAVQDG